jgi:hypothetical protein
MSALAAKPARAAFAARAPFAVRLLHVVLFVTILASSVALIEPSPHDALVGLLAILSIAAGVTIDRKIVPLVFLLVIWNIGGLFALAEIVTQKDALQYAATSLYLAVAAILFACIVTEDSVQRMRLLCIAYVISAVAASCIGIAAYFRLVPLADQFLLYGRVKATFKDPNVFGPFLILPLLYLVQLIVARGPRILTTGATLVLLVALFLSFSRGAWFHFVLSAAVMIALMFVTAATHRERVKIIGLSGLAIAGVALLLVALLSVSSLRTMLLERAQLVQSYDVGEGGRFRLQELAFGTLFDKPFGLGPLEFGRIFGLQQHNSYLQAFMVYGWVGGVTYLVMVVITLIVGLRGALIRTPWQPYLLMAYGAFVGEAAESFIIDSDHWRHYFLILGLVWGLSAASLNARRISRQMPKIA